MFQSHDLLVRDTEDLGQLDLSQVLLMRDSRFPWLILVPRLEGLRDLTDLTDEDLARLMTETRRCASAFDRLFSPDKLNVAALGNMVPQLHLHVIARYKTDAAWPGPVWCKGEAVPYEPADLDTRIADLRGTLGID
jgi:diadenosine tetraphosphate (Ap4A) HIT family hydrolase